jgi:homoserine O-acetyltransferase
MIAVLVTLAAQIAAPSTGWGGGPAPAAKVAWPTRQQHVMLRDFRFHDGETLRQAKMHVTTLGSPHRDAAGQIDNAVMVLHGTGGSGSQFLQPQFAEELYAPGQPLDIRRYFIILPDDLGHGSSSKPSDGLRMHFRNMTMTTWSRRSGGWWSKARAWLTSG